MRSLDDLRMLYLGLHHVVQVDIPLWDQWKLLNQVGSMLEARMLEWDLFAYLQKCKEVVLSRLSSRNLEFPQEQSSSLFLPF